MVEVMTEGERLVAMMVEERVEEVAVMEWVMTEGAVSMEGAVKGAAQTVEKVEEVVHIKLAHHHTMLGSC